jgi:hypothetical protein
MDILPLPAELVVEPALLSTEEVAKYAVQAGDAGSLAPRHPAL